MTAKTTTAAKSNKTAKKHPGHLNAVRAAAVPVGFLSGLATLVLLALFAYRQPDVSSTQGSSLSLLSLLLPAILAAAAMGAALWRSPGVLVLAFVISFVPQGLYFMLNPGFVRWIGIAQIGYLIAAGLLFLPASAADSVTTAAASPRP